MEKRNEVEGKFGTGKRRYGLGLIKAKLQETTQADIGMNLFAENMEHQIREDLKSFSANYLNIRIIGRESRQALCDCEEVLSVLQNGRWSRRYGKTVLYRTDSSCKRLEIRTVHFLLSGEHTKTSC